MPSDLSVDLSGIRAEIERMQRMLTGAQMTGIMRYVGGRIGAIAEDYEYPRPSGKPLPRKYRWPGSNKLHKFPSPKAQREFFDKLKSGEIRVPYRRTGQLGRSITSTVDASPTDVEIRVGSNLVYAPEVIGEPRQQADYHRGHWTPLSDNIAGKMDEIERAAVDSFIDRAIQVLGQG